MQNRNVALATILLTLLAVAAWADVTGTWKGEFTGPDGNSFTLTYSFKQDGDKLTGTVEGPGGPLDLQDGKVTGNKISFWVTVDMGGNSAKFVSEGTVKGDEISLTTKMEGGDMEFPAMTLKRQK